MKVEARSGRRRALTAAGVLPTFDRTRGTAGEQMFVQLADEKGYQERTSGNWPSEQQTITHPPGKLERLHTADNEAVYRLTDGTLVHVQLGWGSVHVCAAGADRAAITDAVAAFQGLYPATYLDATSDRVPVTFWAHGPMGPVQRLRMIEASPWASISGNYSAAVRGELDGMMSGFQPGKGGQLILWQGEPGTGKTWALRALVSEWLPWAEFHYITDPDAFFVDYPSYMIDVLLADSYGAIEPVSGDVVDEANPEGKWRILILEDTGELLSAQAKEKYGQGLSRLLNVVDGMIGQGLRVLVLVTTNDELGELNPAVRRPGRCAAQIEFIPMSAEEVAVWLGTEAADGATIAELYQAHGEAADALSAAEDAPEAAPVVAAALGDRRVPPFDGSGPHGFGSGPHGFPVLPAGLNDPLPAFTPLSAFEADPDVVAEIAKVAEAHAPEGGYGDTAYNPETRTVFWVSADWTSNDELDAAQAAFLAIDGVDEMDGDAECALPGGDGWQQVWPAPSSDAALDRAVTLASRPLEL